MTEKGIQRGGVEAGKRRIKDGDGREV